MKTRLPLHCMVLRSRKRLAPCEAMLQAIISGTASSGGKKCSRMAPATAENANPASPETNAPANAATVRTAHGIRPGKTPDRKSGKKSDITKILQKRRSREGYRRTRVTRWFEEAAGQSP